METFFGDDKKGAKGEVTPLSPSEKMNKIDKWMHEKEPVQEVVALIYSSDGSGKTGLALSYPLKEGEKVVVIDVDGGALPIAAEFHKEKWKSGELIVKDPLEINEETLKIDYEKTMENVFGAIEWIKRNREKENIKLLIIDGVSTLLKYAEGCMRADLDIKVDDGVSLRYWQRRNLMFENVVVPARSLPLNVIFIGHEDFIIGAEGGASIKVRLNQMAFQKICCERRVGLDATTYIAKIDKSKFKPKLDNKEFEFGKMTEQAISWNGQKLWETLLR